MTNDLGIHAPLPSRKDFRIGILGSGFIVNECRLVAYSKAGFNPVAIASRTRAKAEMVAQRHAIPKVYDTPEQLLHDPSIEILDIAVPPDAQLAFIKAACQRKTVKGILAQKPLGLSYAKAVEAVELCEAAGIKLAVNQSMRYDPSVRAAKTLLDNGTIGDPVFATIDMRGIPHWNSWQADLGRFTLRSMSIHHLDCFRYWFGDPEGIYCSIRTDPRTKFPHTDGIASYIVEYANGLRCVGIDDTWTGPALEGCPSDIRIQWRIEGLNGLAMGEIGWCKDPYTSPSSIRYASKGDKEFHLPVWTESWLPDAFIGTMAQLLMAVEKNEEPEISGRDNLKTIALVDAAYLSAAQFRSVGLDEIEKISSRATQPKLEAIEPAAKGEAKEAKSFLSRMISMFTPEPSSESMNNFTPRAQEVLALARKEADRFNHNFVGTEHVLLGMIKLGQGVAVNVLQKLRLDLETVRMEVEKQVGTGPDQKMIGNIPYTPRVKKVLALAAKEGKNLNHTYVGTEHILLGLLREGDGVAARVLKNLGVDIEQTRQEILEELDPNLEPSIRRETLRSAANVPSTTGTSQGPGEAMSNFTPRACQVLALARKQADRFGHNFVGPEHLLIGLIGLGQGVAANELSRLGLVLDTVRIEVQKQLGTGPDPKLVGSIPYTPAIKKVFARAAGWAQKLNHTYVGTEHILLGLLDDDGGATVVIRNLGQDPDRIRLDIIKELDPNFELPIRRETPNRLANIPSSTDTSQAPVEAMSNLTPRAQQVLALSRKEADRFNHNFVGTEPLLLGIIKLGQGVAFNVLQKLGLDFEALRTEIEKQVVTGPDQKMIGNIPYTPRVKKVLALAAKEAKHLNHTYVGTEHILLGLLGEGDGIAARVLKNLNINIDQTRLEILKELDPNFEPSTHLETPRRSVVTSSSVDTAQVPAEAKSNFTPEAQKVVRLAHEEANRLNHNFVGTAHIFLGLIKLREGVAINVLIKLGFKLDTVRMEVEKRVGTNPHNPNQQKAPGDELITPRAKKVFAAAANEAKLLHHTYVGPEHILLGILRDGDNEPARVLKQLDLDLEQTRKAILKELNPNTGS